MDRALSLDILRAAIGEHERLPSATDVRGLIADAEIAIFTGGANISEQLLDTAWYLQSVATARADLDLYELPRQRVAHQVSGHIFDLAVQSQDMSDRERMRYTFAAQVGYLGGELTPNAAAVAARLPVPSRPHPWSDNALTSLEVGIAVLALNRSVLYPLLTARRGQLRDFAERFGDLSATSLAAVEQVVEGAWHLVNYLTYGTTEERTKAEVAFRTAISAPAAESDVDSRWVAAHLLRISGELATTSVWAVMPPGLLSAARSMTLGDPPVLALWPPQLSFLSSDDPTTSPLNPSNRRLVLSFPTSAGKSLLAQLLVTAHIAAVPTDVCVIAPSRSLCRELAEGLDRRLRTLGHQLHNESVLALLNVAPPSARVVVMTPERLAARLRRDSAAVLARFSMFVIDEAHLVTDPTRGWNLEETLSFLHASTLESDHRILVLSAALGNQVHVTNWLETKDGLIHQSADWRGPRRLNAIYTSEPDWDNQVETPAVGRRRPRQTTPLTGVLHLNTGNATVRGSFADPVGQLVRRQKKDGAWTSDTNSSTQRAQLVPLVLHVAQSGAVLVVEATRLAAQRLAEELASQSDQSAGDPALSDLVRNRLGAQHPLTKVLEHGIAFHHAALPVDIQSEIESAVRGGRIQVLVATSTLTEGVNLPFKTVIVGSRGYPTKDGFEELIDPAGLLNAVGRAGRAGRETEGWMILAENQSFSDDLFEPLRLSGEDLRLDSTLAADASLAGLSRFEDQARQDLDAVFSNYERVADGFLSFIWFLAETVGDSSNIESNELLKFVQQTLGWQQLDDDQRALLTRCAEHSLAAYEKQPQEARKRWARAGTSLPSARTLQNVANEVAAIIEHKQDFGGPQGAIEVVIGGTRLTTMLALPENVRRGFRPRRNAPKDETVPVDLKDLLLDWIRGVEIQELADRHLTAIPDEGYRAEQLSEFSAAVFEHHLPWTCGLIVAWVNETLQASDKEVQVPDEIPGFIHFGVSTRVALELMTFGVRSRRLANAVAAIAPAEVEQDTASLRTWLATQSIEDWRMAFEASPTELLDLLAYVRSPSAKAVSVLLEGEVLEISLRALVPVADGSEAQLALDPDALPPAPITAVVAGVPVGEVKTADYDDLYMILNLGIPLSVRVFETGADPKASISVLK